MNISINKLRGVAVVAITTMVASAALAQRPATTPAATTQTPPAATAPSTELPPPPAGTTETSNEYYRSDGGLFLEPMLTYGKEDTEIKTSQLPIITDDTTGTMMGAGLGLRFGGHVKEIFFLAADGRYQKADFDDSFYNKASSESYNYGLTAGMQTPFYGVRVWGTTVLGGQMDPAAGNSGLDVKFKDTKGYRVGAGLHVAAVAVNLEYQDLRYDNSETQSLGSLNGTADVDFTQKGAVLSLGFPIEL